MLRVSSPGLNILTSSYFTFHSCQRVYRFGATGRTLCSTSKKTGPQFRSLEHTPSIDVEEGSPLTGEQVHTKIGSLTAHSMIVKENSSNQPSTLPPMSTTDTASELQLSEPEPTKPIQTTENVLEEVYSTSKAPNSRLISQSPPSNVAGRPWSPQNVKKVTLPKYMLGPLRRLRIEAARSCRLDELVKNFGKDAFKWKKKSKSLRGDLKQAQNAGEDTPSTKEPPLHDDKPEQKAGEDTPSIKEPPLQDHKQEQNAGEDTPSMKEPPFQDHKQKQNADDTPSVKEPPFQDHNQEQNAGEDTPSMKEPPFQDHKQKQNAGEDTPSVKEPPFQDHKQEQNAGEDTPSMKEPSFPDHKQEQNAGKDTPSMKEPPFQDHKQEQNAGEDTPSMKEPPFQDHKQEQNAGEDTPSMKEPSFQAHKQEQNAGEDTPSMKEPPFQDYKQEQNDPAFQLERHLTVMATTDSVEKGWNSYVFLVDFISGSPVVLRHVQHIPFVHLHRLVRLLSRNRPRTHRQFRQLLAVLTYINYWGGEVKPYEWNALVVHAGSGWRKTTLGNLRKALKVFNDMRAGRLPGSSNFLPPDRKFLEGSPVEPDIYTYTSLLAIASRTMHNRKVHKISSMLSKAGLHPNRITHLSLMKYYTLKGDLNGIRATLMKMRHQGLELGLDGLNSCMWGYGRGARPDLVMMIYRILRHNVLPETALQKDIDRIIERLGEEYIFVEPEIQPNEITFTTVIQVMAYHGHFSSALNVFMDMLSFDNLEKGASLEMTSADEYVPTPYKPTLAVFRAIFLGFSRHAKHIQGWNMENLSYLFDLFLELPSDSNITHNTVYFIMLAFDKASDRDNKMLRRVWERIDRRFGIVFHKTHSVSRLARLQRLLFPEREEIR